MPNSIFSLGHIKWGEVNLNSLQIESIAKRLSTIYLDKKSELLWLLRAISFCDNTTLMGDDSISNVRQLCYASLHPLSTRTVTMVDNTLEIDGKNLTVAAVCVYPNQVAEVHSQLARFDIGIASVAAGFPSGQYPMESRLLEIKYCISQGATEVDIVINRTLVLQGRWQELYDELVDMRKACSVKLKTILEVGQLGSYKNIYQASMVAMLAGADFIKTSTGKECSANATLPVSLVMLISIFDFYQSTGIKVGFKPAGGIKTADDALKLMALVYNILGETYLDNKLFRLGCSSLIGNLEKRILTILTGNILISVMDMAPY